MTPIENYYQRILDSKCPSAVRKQIVDVYNSTRNISFVARFFKTTRKTVRKIIRRYESEGADGLKDRSRRPHQTPKAISPALEAKIVALRKCQKLRPRGEKIELRLGQERIRWFLAQHGIFVSVSTINRVLHKYGLIKPRLKKWQKRRVITQYRKSLKPFTLWQVDVKYLRDVPNLYGLILDGVIPAYQYSARDVATGTTFFAYAEEFSLINSMRFVWLLLCHLEFFGIDTSAVIIQTDNGGEFIGAVENFHDRIEDEFYDIERFSGRA
ncbi:MAG: helix-turn-helix domain-containing protein [bacterium]